MMITHIFRYSLMLALSLLATATSAQQLKPREIVYSRMPANVNLPPIEANSPTIWVVGQDGSNDRQITTGTAPRISDDGRFLLFKRFTRNPTGFNPYGGYADFFVRDLASGQETLVLAENFDQSSFGHYFSPESNQGNFEIIFDDSCLMYKMNANGSGITFLYPTSNPAFCGDDFPAVRRGGDQLIVFHNLSTDPANNGLVTVGINGTGRQRIANTDCGSLGPAWSNDDQFISFGTLFQPCGTTFPQSAYPYLISNLWKIRADGTGKQQLTNFSSGNCATASTNCLAMGMVWTENNSRIIVAGRFNGTPGIYSIDADGSASFSQIPISPGNPPDFIGGIVQPRVERQVIASGGGLSETGNYSLVSTIGEPIAGLASSGGTYDLASGFWARPHLRHPFFDYDGDGKTDISVFRPSDGGWYLLRSQAGLLGVGFGTVSDKIVPADYDGDGRTDVAVYRPATGIWYVINSATNTLSYYSFGVAEDLPAPADHDGDGRADVCVFRPSSGTFYRQFSSNGVISAVQFGAAGDHPTVGDFDGDGKADIAVYRPANGGWYRLNSSDGNFVGIQFGFATDVIAPADFDGDGRTDVAVYRPAEGYWYLITSSNNAFVATNFGLANDWPAPGDYDGDGRADLTVFRPSDGTWYRLNSSNGVFVAQPFGANGDLPTPAAYR